MKILVVGRNDNKYLNFDNIRENYFVNVEHEKDNIDHLNPWYCELTALHYLKHIDDDIVGIEHYRNYFWNNKENRLASENDFKEVLQEHDIVCSGFKYPIYYGKYDKMINGLEFFTNGDIHNFLEFFKSYDSDFCKFFQNDLEGQELYCCNVFVAKKEIINVWLNYIFNLLKAYDIHSPLNDKNLRRNGYYSEYLFSSWLKYTSQNIIHMDTTKFTRDLTDVSFKVIGIDKQIQINNK